MAHLKEALAEQLQDLFDAENQLTRALPRMAEAANHPTLKQAFETHLAETQGQVERLKQVFSLLGSKAEPKPCRAMAGLVEEGKETIEEGKTKEPLEADLALIAVAQKVVEVAHMGYDAVVGTAFLDNGLDAARELVEIPVVGPAKTTMYMAATLAHATRHSPAGSQHDGRHRRKCTNR